jgi:hypothetical protein
MDSMPVITQLLMNLNQVNIWFHLGKPNRNRLLLVNGDGI